MKTTSFTSYFLAISILFGFSLVNPNLSLASRPKLPLNPPSGKVAMVNEVSSYNQPASLGVNDFFLTEAELPSPWIPDPHIRRGRICGSGKS